MDNESKVLTVLKSTKLLHEYTITLFTNYLRACMHIAWCKKARYCERNFDVCFVVIGIGKFGKLNQIYKLDVTKFKFNILFVDILKVQVFCKKRI